MIIWQEEEGGKKERKKERKRKKENYLVKMKVETLKFIIAQFAVCPNLYFSHMKMTIPPKEEDYIIKITTHTQISKNICTHFIIPHKHMHTYIQTSW